MLEQAQLAEQFRKLLEQERLAEASYGELIQQLDDTALRQQVEQLLRDKQRHIRLTQRLLEILE